MRLHELRAARWWGCPSPGAWDALPLDEKLDVLAAYEAEWKMDVINQYESERKARQAARKAQRGRGGRR